MQPFAEGSRQRKTDTCGFTFWWKLKNDKN